MIEGYNRFYHLFITEIVLNPWFYGVVAVVYLLERFFPSGQQRLVGRGTLTDLMWTPFYLAFLSFVLPVYLLFLHSVYDAHLDFLTIKSIVDWPWGVRVVLAILVEDFIIYLTHVLRHKVVVLWHFHAVHHSQKEMSFFTNYRVHPLDDMILFTLGFIPYFAILPSPISIVTIVWLQSWHTRITHSNIRTNFGWLKYILVTPQSHRVHHSVELEHRDKNFGRTFSIWDQLFGTQHWDFDEYPATGIDDETFPVEQKKGWLAFATIWIAQLAYPFQKIAAGVRLERSGPETRVQLPAPPAG